jgi:hypothetical protein
MDCFIAFAWRALHVSPTLAIFDEVTPQSFTEQPNTWAHWLLARSFCSWTQPALRPPAFVAGPVAGPMQEHACIPSSTQTPSSAHQCLLACCIASWQFMKSWATPLTCPPSLPVDMPALAVD